MDALQPILWTIVSALDTIALHCAAAEAFLLTTLGIPSTTSFRAFADTQALVLDILSRPDSFLARVPRDADWPAQLCMAAQLLRVQSIIFLTVGVLYSVWLERRGDAKLVVGELVRRWTEGSRRTALAIMVVRTWYFLAALNAVLMRMLEHDGLFKHIMVVALLGKLL
ncbi:hypothetical protein KJ359_002734 [Pestalotiopsis sp. 9143b]|nr:hypothetical protein KJ359_002734 [Pestalotiopsis sp. 9143b]